MRGALTLIVALSFVPPLAAQQPLPGTKPLTMQGDLAAQMVAGIDKYLSRELTASVAKRSAHWKQDFSSPEAYAKSVRPNRERLKKILGVVDQRLPVKELACLGKLPDLALSITKDYRVYAVRWPVLPGVEGEGLLLEPNRGVPVTACVIALPDADQTPEQLLASLKGLAEQGCLILVPAVIDRSDRWAGNLKRGWLTNQPHREFVYRMAFEMGRHIIGYEVQRVLAAVDWLKHDKDHLPLGVLGYGEGGLLALYSAAVDERITAACVSGYFGPREELWQEPIYRNVWGLLTEFGDAELAMLVAPRRLIVDYSAVPDVKGPPAARKGRTGAAPGKLQTPSLKAVQAEVARAENACFAKLAKTSPAQLTLTSSKETLRQFLADLNVKAESAPAFAPPPPLVRREDDARQRRQVEQLVDYTQKLLPEGEHRREEFFASADRSSPESWQKSTQRQRDYFWDEIIGKLPAPTLPVNARSRLLYDEPRWKGYEVVLDLYDDVFCHGILLVPNDLKPGERRPVVVCQHGLEGRPTDVVNPKERTRYYNSFGAQLADLGYIVFAPQNPYIGGNTFRQLQRKANPLKLSIYSFIVRQHERILDWLSSLPFVDASRIAYYGLSYGGKVAMRIPALLGRYCLSICSGDFNEWIWKNITMFFRSSYMFTGEYEMYEFDLGSTFNYAEMAALIAPRPFMVERGHNDGVGIDEQVAYEYAKVRRLYARLGIPDRTAIEFFQGGHEVRGQGTFAFLHRHLRWTPRP